MCSKNLGTSQRFCALKLVLSTSDAQFVQACISSIHSQLHKSFSWVESFIWHLPYGFLYYLITLTWIVLPSRLHLHNRQKSRKNSISYIYIIDEKYKELNLLHLHNRQKVQRTQSQNLHNRQKVQRTQCQTSTQSTKSTKNSISYMYIIDKKYKELNLLHLYNRQKVQKTQSPTST